MSDEDLDINFDNELEVELTKKQIDERKRFLREQIELREMAKELGLSLED